MKLLTSLFALAPAGEGGLLHNPWFVTASLVVNAAVFFGFLILKLKPAIGTGLKSRRAGMEVRLKEAEEKQQAAEAQYREYEAKLANLEREVDEIVAGYQREAEADRQKIEDDTERAIERLSRESEFTIKQEIRKAEMALKEATKAATLKRAESLIRERISPEDKARLVKTTIGQIGNGSAA